jgi:hypothetical protein
VQLAASESITLRTGVVRIEAARGSTAAPTILFGDSSGGSVSSSSTAAASTGNWVLTQVRFLH